MSRCEDWPACGHESGCCPDFDESGKQLNMRCVCGVEVPIDSRYSICETCLRSGEDEYYEEEFDFDDEFEEEEDDFDDDFDDEFGFEYENQHLEAEFDRFDG